MKKLLMTFALSIITLIGFAQEKGSWYVGTGDIANVAVGREKHSVRWKFSTFESEMREPFGSSAWQGRPSPF